MRSRSLLLAERPCCLTWSANIHAGVGHLSCPSESRDFIFFPFLTHLLSLKILHIKLQSTPTLLISDRGVCISFHLFNSPNACRHQTRWLVVCAVPSLHHCTSIFILSFWPITFGCPVSLRFNNVKASTRLVGFLRFLRFSVLEAFIML